MHGNPSGTADSHCTDFFVSHPYPRKSFNPACPNTKISTSTNDSFFPRPEILMHVGEVVLQINNRISNQLSRAVIGNITAPVDMNELCVDFSQFSNSLKQVIIIPALPEGINMWVLHIKQHIRGGGLVYVLPIFVQFSIDQQPLSLFLKIPDRSVLRFSKINY